MYLEIGGGCTDRKKSGHVSWLVDFYGISTFVGYLMPILFIFGLEINSLLVSLFLNEVELICLRTVKWFQVLLFNVNNSIH